MGRSIAFFLFFALLIIYIVVILLPAFQNAGGIPPDFLSLIWPPALMVVGYAVLFFGSGWIKKQAEEQAAKKAAEGKKE